MKKMTKEQIEEFAVGHPYPTDYVECLLIKYNYNEEKVMEILLGSSENVIREVQIEIGEREKITEDFLSTVSLMKKYMESERPQSFASMYGLYQIQKRKCELYGIDTSNLADIEKIESYAKKEEIEQFGFEV